MKTCSSCKKLKSFDSFSTNGSTMLADGSTVVYRKSECKECKATKVLLNRRNNKKAYLRSKWIAIKNRCEKSKTYIGFSYPSCDEFIDWALKRDDFNDNFYAWILSGYDLQMSASIDRIDNNKGYEFSNMQFIPFWYNSKKDRKKPTILLKDGNSMKYESRLEAIKGTGLSLKSFYRVMKGAKVKGWELP